MPERKDPVLPPLAPPHKPKPPKKYNGGKPGIPMLQDAPCQTFIENIDKGGFREEFIGALDAAEKDVRWHQLKNMMTLDFFKKYKFSTLTRMLGLTPENLVDFWRNHQIQAGIVQTMNELPQIMSDVAEDAKSRMVYCQKCDGIGQVLDGFDESVAGKRTPLLRICPACEGAKKVRQVGDKDARNLVFETAGLTKKHGPMVAIQMNSNSPLEATVDEIGNILNSEDE